ncbi:MAG: hypothetical protein LBM71_03955 [Elusimicrobiota bacterium]|jgi:cell shape-determining protein MreD|nr:hypothetical protein [Elusimicrobiota bacterium]
MLKLINAFLIFIVATIAHWFAIEIFAPFDINVGVMFAFSLVMASVLSEGAGYTFAFVSGLFLDFFGNVLFGGWALTFTLMMIIFYQIDDKIDFKDIGPQFVITLFLNMACVILYGLFGKIFTGEFIWQGFKSLLLGSFLTGVLLPLVYLLVLRYLAFAPFVKINEKNKTIF